MRTRHTQNRDKSSLKWRRRLLAGLTSVVVGATASLTGAVAAHADPIVNWPAIEFWAEPSFLSSQGITATSETPTLQFFAVDGVSEDPYPDYDLALKIEDDSDPAVLVVDEDFDTDRDDTWSSVNWEVPPSVLEEGEVYWLTMQLSTSTESGPWSAPLRLQIGEPVAAPTLVAPTDDALVESEVALQADVGTAIGEEVIFRVEANWEDLPVEVSTGSATTDGAGVASFEPDLDLDEFDEAHLRWQAKVQGQGYSEWSEFEEFRVSWKPGAIYNPGAVQYEEQGNRQNRIDVTWGGNDGYYLSYAPTNLYTIELEPGGIVRTFEECNPLPPTWTCLTSFEGLALDEYEVSIFASNALGDGPATTIPVEISSYVPDPPADLEMDLELNDVEFTWGAPADLHGGTFEHYAWVLSPWSCPDSTTITGTTQSTSIDFEDLQEGCQHDFHVATVTDAGEVGTGIAFTPYGLPGAPTDPLLVQSEDGAIDVYWTDALDNGAPVTEYTITVSPGGQVIVVDPLEVGWWRQGTQVTGLTNGVEYTFSIVASNAAGAGPALVTDSIEPTDGQADSDLDGLVDAIEERVGTDILLPDTDGDGVGDFEEVDSLAGFSDPLVADTDGNSVEDGLDDVDEDGITNLDEIVNGTSPVSDDTDADDITDPDELTEGTNPLLADTDADGLDDTFELEQGFDPTVADSDSDSTPDGEETIALALESGIIEEDEDLGAATAEITGEAAAAELVRIDHGRVWELPGALTTAAMVSASEPKTMGPPSPPAQVTELKLPYASWVEEQLNDLQPVRYNEATGTWEFVDNDVTVTTATHTITIDSPELGLRYAVVDLSAWRANANQCLAAENGEPPLDVDLRIDATWSVDANDPTGERFEAARTVLSHLRPGDRVTVNLFGFLGIYASRGWGDANAYEPTSWYATADSAFGGLKPVVMSPAAALQTLDRIEAAGEDALLEDESSVAPEIVALWTEKTLHENANFVDDSAKCRVRTVVLVTDGEAKPLSSLSGNSSHFPSGYLPFRNRTAPVHVLDVGIGTTSSSEWLEDLADDTEGTYSYVPTAGDLVSWIEDVLPYDWEPPESSDTTDTDEDGIPDNVEVRGVVSTFGLPQGSAPVRYTSNPNDVDTDNDGLRDGEEIGVVVSPAMLGLSSNLGALGYNVRSNPRSVDTDSDDLGDLDEHDLGYDPFNANADFDDLDDGEELTWGTSPKFSDTDGDGYSDSWEVEHQSEGFKPTVRDERLSTWVWLEDLATGYVMGDFHYVDRIGWLIGTLVSGYLILGDIRDIIANSISGKWVSVGFVALGLIPVIGDAVRSVNLIIKFINRTSKSANIDAALRLGNMVDDTTEYLRLIDDVAPVIVNKLIDQGVPVSRVQWLIDKVGANHLETLLNHGKRVDAVRPNASSTPTFNNPNFRLRGKDGEAYVHAARGETQAGQFRTYMSGSSGPYRYYDMIIDGIYYEIKTGKATLATVTAQIAKDATMNSRLDAEVRWIFVPSSFSGIGPDPAVLSALNSAGIKFEIHWPT